MTVTKEEVLNHGLGSALEKNVVHISYFGMSIESLSPYLNINIYYDHKKVDTDIWRRNSYNIILPMKRERHHSRLLVVIVSCWLVSSKKKKRREPTYDVCLFV